VDEAVVDYPEVAAPELDPSAYAGAQFDDIPLALLPQQIALLVAARGDVDDDLSRRSSEVSGNQMSACRSRSPRPSDPLSTASVASLIDVQDLRSRTPPST
jgi:hypothetical protein